MNYRRQGVAQEGQCSGMTYVNNWPGNCLRAAVEDGLCTPHLTGKRRRDARAEKDRERWDESQRHYRAKRAQEKFVEQWRAEHAGDTWGESWTCPLCNKVLQASEVDEAYRQFMLGMKDRHQRSHGADWLAFCAALDGAAEPEE